MQANSILFSDVDREDRNVASGLCIKVDEATIGMSYRELYNLLKPRLEMKEVVEYVIEDNCLDHELFNYDNTFKFKRTFWDFNLVYEFENSEGDIVQFAFTQTDTILTLG